jgi:hypothetical protein
MVGQWRCRQCGMLNAAMDLLHAPSPFRSDEELIACGSCKSCEGFDLLCDEPGCTDIAHCGWLSPAGYRRTCGKHGEWDHGESNAKSR